VLYISGSVGLGHATRDMAIVNELRRVCRDVEIVWLASGPAKMLLEERKETLLEESDSYYDVNEAARSAAKGTSLNLFRYGKRAGKGWFHNIALFKKIISRYSFGLVVADEAYEISYYICKAKGGRRPVFVEIVDFIGFEPMTGRPAERIQLWVMNRVWARTGKREVPGYHTLFVGEPDDVPDERFGSSSPESASTRINGALFSDTYSVSNRGITRTGMRSRNDSGTREGLSLYVQAGGPLSGGSS